jgi:methionyl-tRNA synthetase
MLKAMNVENTEWPANLAEIADGLPAGHAFVVPDNLFRKITDDEAAEWKERFAGKRT